MEDSSDKSTVFGLVLSPEIHFATKLFSASPDIFTIVPKSDLELLLNYCTNYVENKTFARKNYFQIRENVLSHWKRSQIMLQLNLNSHDFDRIFSGLLKLIQCIKANLKNVDSIELLEKEILQQTKAPKELLKLTFNQLIDSQTKLSKIFLNSTSLPGRKIISIKWRLDVVVADLSLSKVLQPIIKFELLYNTSNSNIKSLRFDCTIEQFHRFRFMTACALRELNRLQNKLS